MAHKLALSIAVGPYDRMRALIDGEVAIDGVDPIVMTFTPEEMFFRAFRHAEFDVCELSMSSQTVKVARRENAYVGVPVFPSRAFRHTSIYVRRDRIGKPEDLKGKRIGVPEYQMTAPVWIRGILSDDYGVKVTDVTGEGIDQPGRPEDRAALPPSIRVEAAPANDTISAMLDRGDLDGYTGAAAVAATRTSAGCSPTRPPRRRIITAARASFPSCTCSACGARWSSATRGSRRRCQRSRRRRRWRSRSSATRRPRRSRFRSSRSNSRRRELMGDDFWSYGVARNRHVVEAFARHHHAQGLSSRAVGVDEMFDATTFEVSQL
jgi:4,5-dihydroxyphthalate decarboxylase